MSGRGNRDAYFGLYGDPRPAFLTEGWWQGGETFWLTVGGWVGGGGVIQLSEQ